MSDQSVLDNSRVPPVVLTNPHEIVLQSLCKQLLKSRLFRGFYVERHYVDSVKDYRDIVSLQKSERSLDKILKDIRAKLQSFYTEMWIGITTGPLTGITKAQPGALETHLWVELKDVAFGQYWFSIKNIRFRENEIILKLKEVQVVEDEEIPKWAPSIESDKSSDCLETSKLSSQTSPAAKGSVENQITLNDFLLLQQQWWATTKQTVYDFMANDISKENIVSVLRFIGLLVFSLLTGAFEAVKFLGIFTLRFMFELSRLTHVLTPIIFKIIEVNKIIGGFYILLAMIWRDTIGNRNKPKYNAIEYNRPMYKSIQYEVHQQRHQASAEFSKTF